jgi:hypothetical protein
MRVGPSAPQREMAGVEDENSQVVELAWEDFDEAALVVLGHRRNGVIWTWSRCLR